MMKKIGIISLFGYNNYGNRLQLYAVQQTYKKLGFETEIIRYHLEEPKEPFIIRLKIFSHNVLNFFPNLKNFLLKNSKESNFKKHAKKYYKESGNLINPYLVADSFHENYSFFSVGSDQIWGWFSHPIADFIFLKFAPKNKRLTFSPSFGTSIIDEKHQELYAKGLNGFEKISVREESGAEIIKRLTGKEATVLCDPTMCLSKEEWLSFASKHQNKPSKKYILTYFLGEKSAKVEGLISHLSKDYEVVELNSIENPKYYAANPSEWVDYIDSASLFLTDSFHGVVFSLLLQTPFLVYKRIGGEEMQTRITHILEKFNMNERFEVSEISPSLFKTDFSQTEKLIATEKSKVLTFLDENLKTK